MKLLMVYSPEGRRVLRSWVLQDQQAATPFHGITPEIDWKPYALENGEYDSKASLNESVQKVLIKYQIASAHLLPLHDFNQIAHEAQGPDELRSGMIQLAEIIPGFVRAEKASFFSRLLE